MSKTKTATKTMQAFVFEGVGKYKVKDLPVPRIKSEDEVLLKIESAGICGTDLHICSVPPGHPAGENVVLGHEFVGTIVEKGEDVSAFEIGDRVVADPNLTCGHCRYCQDGMHNFCDNMTTLGIFIDGGFAEYTVTPYNALFKISGDVKPEYAALVEPLACVVNGTEKVKVQPGQAVLIIGAGPIGMLFLEMFKASGAGKIFISEPQEFRASVARKAGATRVINPLKENLKDVIMEETGRGCDVIVDAVGSRIQDAMDCAAKGADILLFGQNKNARASISQDRITRGEWRIIGTYISRHNFPRAIKIIENGILSPDNVITDVLPLSEIEKGFEKMRSGKALKVIIKL